MPLDSRLVANETLNQLLPFGGLRLDCISFLVLDCQRSRTAIGRVAGE
jgi:hypothetical protein